MDPYENPQPSTSSSSCHDIRLISTSSLETAADESDEASRHEDEPQKKKRYNQKFNTNWQNQYNWIKEGNDGKPLCVACNIQIYCNKYNLKRHGASTSHQKNINKMKNTPKITQIISSEKHDRHNTLVKTAELSIPNAVRLGTYLFNIVVFLIIFKILV